MGFRILPAIVEGPVRVIGGEGRVEVLHGESLAFADNTDAAAVVRKDEAVVGDVGLARDAHVHRVGIGGSAEVRRHVETLSCRIV